MKIAIFNGSARKENTFAMTQAFKDIRRRPGRGLDWR